VYYIEYVVDARGYVQAIGIRADQLYNGILSVPPVELLRGPIGLNVIQSELYLVSHTEPFCDLLGPVSVFLL